MSKLLIALLALDIGVSLSKVFIFTLGSKFTYKFIPDDDLPTVTSIFKKIGTF